MPLLRGIVLIHLPVKTMNGKNSNNSANVVIRLFFDCVRGTCNILSSHTSYKWIHMQNLYNQYVGNVYHEMPKPSATVPGNPIKKIY